MNTQEKAKRDKDKSIQQGNANSQTLQDKNSGNTPERWDEKSEASKKQGDKGQEEQSKKVDKIRGQSGSNTPDYIEEDYQDTQEPQGDADAEYMDHQDLNETKDDDFQQPQSMSRGLSSIYPGRPSTQREREELAEERQREITAEENRRKNSGQHQQSAFSESRNQMSWKDNPDNKSYLDTERGNYGRHKDYQDRQGRERGRNLENEYPSEERNRYSYRPDRYEGQGPERREGQPHPYGDTPSWEHDEYRNHIRQGGRRRRVDDDYESKERGRGFPSARQNSWDDNMTDYRGYEETDYNDREVRRRRDEGRKPWDSDSDYGRDYDRRGYREEWGRFDERRDYDRDYDRGYRSEYDRGERRGRREDFPERRRPSNYDQWRREDYRRDFREEDYDNRDYDRYDSRNIERGRRRRRDDW